MNKRLKKKIINYEWTNETHHTPSIIENIDKILNKTTKPIFDHADIGCGNGFITNKMNKYFRTSIGIDLSKQGIYFANKHYKSKNQKFYLKDMQNLINEKKKFNYVTTIEVIEHQYDPFKFMEYLEKIVKKNGFLLISTPFHGYFKNLIMSIFGLMDNHFTALWNHGHIKFFSIKTLKKLISNYKFEIVDISYSGRIYPLSSSMIFLLKRK
ncbi:class I SAM-dependent methyltransferase [Candidatus Pelagibacter sp.]|nr:class I SAM-dependent methyltransferase [Candidatus Pelagibacter sp.]MDB2446836.1 class I SAM-dependent methyltransferase [Candidatus Pelagibacter bacterium]